MLGSGGPALAASLAALPARLFAEATQEVRARRSPLISTPLVARRDAPSAPACIG